MSGGPPGTGPSTVLRFLAGGVFNTAVSLLAYWALLRWLPVLVAYSIAFALGVLVGYLVNALFVFRTRPSWRGLAEWPLVPIAGWVVGSATVAIATGPLGVDARLAPLLAIPLTVPVTWWLARRLLRRRAALAPPPPAK